MFITKKHLSRRTVLRGAVGAAISLPFLDAMVPAASAAPPPQFRFGAVYVPNGIRPEIFTPPPLLMPKFVSLLPARLSLYTPAPVVLGGHPKPAINRHLKTGN